MIYELFYAIIHCTGLCYAVLFLARIQTGPGAGARQPIVESPPPIDKKMPRILVSHCTLLHLNLKIYSPARKQDKTSVDGGVETFVGTVEPRALVSRCDFIWNRVTQQSINCVDRPAWRVRNKAQTPSSGFV